MSLPGIRVLDDCESLAKWVLDTDHIGTGSIDTSIKTKGNASVKYTRTVSKSRNYTSNMRITIAATPPYARYDERWLVFNYRWSNPNNQLKVRFLNSAGSNIDGTVHTIGVNVAPNKWYTARVPLHGADLTDIKNFEFTNDGDRYTGWADGESYSVWFDDVHLEGSVRRPHHPTILLQFDDGFASVYNNALPLFKQYGHVGTVAMISEWLGSSYLGLPMLSQAQLLELSANGWEIASHTRTHANMSSASDVQVIDHMTTSKAQLEALGLKINHFTYPFTQWRAFSYEESKKHYTSARIGTPPLQNTRENSIYGGTDPFKLVAQAIVSTTTFGQVIKWIEDSIRNDTLLILYFHDISPGAPTTDSCDPMLLERILAHMNRRGVGTMQTTQALKEFGFIK